MTPKEAAEKLKGALSESPKVKVKDGKVFVETPDGDEKAASQIQAHKFK